MASVAVIIPTRGRSQMLRKCLKALYSSIGETFNVRVYVIEGGGTECAEMIEKRFPDKGITRLRAGDDWSFSEINNYAAKKAADSNADYLLLLNNDTLPRPGFAGAMAQVLDEREDVAVVGAKLVFPDRSIQHCGVAFRQDGVPYHLGYRKDDDGTFAPAMRDDFYDAVTFACAMIRRSVWDELGGLDTDYFFNYEDTDFCLRAREKGYRIMLAHRAVVVHDECQSADLRKSAKHSMKRNLAVYAEKWLNNDRLERVAGLKFHVKPAIAAPERRNILFIPSARSAGVPWWRMELPSRAVSKAKLANVAVAFGDMDQARVTNLMRQAHVAVFQGFTSEWVHRVASMGPNRGFKMAYDYDDHPIYISPFSQAYKWFGLCEKKIRASDGSEAWLWRDGESGFDLKRNHENRQRQLEIFSMVDLVTTSTPALHTYFSGLNKKVALLPNCIDFSIYRRMTPLWERKPGPVRIGWHGGDNHFHDVSTISRELVEYVNAHDVCLVVFGAYYRGPFRGIDPNKVIEEPWVHVEAFPYKLATLGIDVAVIPLADPALPDMQFNRYKSPIKYYEYAALRVPSLVAANRQAYAVCTDGENCLTYGSGQEFTEKLDRLCKDAGLRKQLAQRAYEWVYEYANLETNAYRWTDAYESIIEDADNDEDPGDEGPKGLKLVEQARSNAVAEGAAAEEATP